MGSRCEVAEHSDADEHQQKNNGLSELLHLNSFRFWEVPLRGLHAFEPTKVDFPYQNGNSLPGKVRTDCVRRLSEECTAR